MQNFTTRPEIRGTFGAVTSTHWIASAVGMSILEKGGNAFDAAVATGFVLQVVEPHLNGPAGDLPVIFHSARDERVGVLCAQGPAPAAATIETMKAMGIDELIPGSGLLATVVPGAFDGWLLLLRDHGTMELADVLTPAIEYCAEGHPLLPSVADMIASLQIFFEKQWPTSAKVWCPQGESPKALSLFKNGDLAKTYGRLLDAAQGKTREARIDAARNEWRSGFVAEAIGDYVKDARVMDVTGRRNIALLTQDDMAGWRAGYEAPIDD